MWHIYTMEYYSATKRNKSESALVSWVKLGHVIQSEISQKEENKHHILTHVYGIEKNGTDEPICRAAIETQT